MDDIVLIGGGGHAKVLISIIKKSRQFNIIGYLDLVDKRDVLGVKYLGLDNKLESLTTAGLKIAAMGIGKIDCSELRMNVVSNILKYKIKFPPIISKDCIINESVKVNKGVQVFDGAIINSGSVLSEYCIINSKALVEHDCSIGKFTHIAPGVTISGNVTIGSNVLLGAGSILIQGINICDNVVIGAGSVVVRDIVESGIYVGNPCRRIG